MGSPTGHFKLRRHTREFPEKLDYISWQI